MSHPMVDGWAGLRFPLCTLHFARVGPLLNMFCCSQLRNAVNHFPQRVAKVLHHPLLPNKWSRISQPPVATRSFDLNGKIKRWKLTRFAGFTISIDVHAHGQKSLQYLDRTHCRVPGRSQSTGPWSQWRVLSGAERLCHQCRPVVTLPSSCYKGAPHKERCPSWTCLAPRWLYFFWCYLPVRWLRYKRHEKTLRLPQKDLPSSRSCWTDSNLAENLPRSWNQHEGKDSASFLQAYHRFASRPG